MLTVKLLGGETHQCDCYNVGEGPEDRQGTECKPVMTVESGYS